jgi:hypothetical protein
MDRNNEGKLTEKERARFQTLLDEVQKITLCNSKMLVDQKRLRESKSAKVGQGTVNRLRMNDPIQIEARCSWLELGLYP